VVERQNVNTDDLQSSSQARYINEAGTSEVPDNLILGNHEASKGMEENSITYTSSGDVYDRSATIANICFSIVIAENFLNDLDPKIMAECKKCLDWNKWKEAIGRLFTELIPTPPRTFPVGFKWVFVRK
jgi:hypothetical protein